MSPAAADCDAVAVRKGADNCSANQLDLLDWINTDPAARQRLRQAGIDHKEAWKLSHEQLGYLGGREATTESLAQAKRSLNAMDVVGVTESMGTTLVLFSERCASPRQIPSPRK